MNDLKRVELGDSLGLRLRKLMNERRVSVSFLSGELSINKSTMHNWVNGGLPQSMFALAKVARFFDVSLDELCFGEKVEPKNGLVIKLAVEIEGEKGQEGRVVQIQSENGSLISSV